MKGNAYPGSLAVQSSLVLWTEHSHHRRHDPFHSELVDVALAELGRCCLVRSRFVVATELGVLARPVTLGFFPRVPPLSRFRLRALAFSLRSWGDVLLAFGPTVIITVSLALMGTSAMCLSMRR